MKFVDLFCGGGFGARGASVAGAEPILAIDAWDVATSTYKENFPAAQVICARIEDINPKTLAKTYRPDVLLTSPECTSHSIARGSKPGTERSRETAIGVVPWVKAMKPNWLIVENVNRMKKWSRHEELIGSIERCGYKVNDLQLNAADFGTPQARKRMFLVCSRQQHTITSEQLISSHSKAAKSASSILDKSGAYKSTLLFKEGRAKSTLERAERAMKALGKGKSFLIVYYSSDYAGGWQSIDSPLRTITTVDRFGLVTWDRKTPYLRMLQPSELVRAMGASSSKHVLNHGSRRDKVKLCGNGVCSPVLEVIFRRISQLENNKKSKAV